MMPPGPQPASLRIGVDVGGTFTDLVASDGTTLHVVKIPSSPPNFHEAVIEAVGRVQPLGRPDRIIHGSTVATNALLQRSGKAVAFITTGGFADMLLIGRQNRPNLYALKVERPRPLSDPGHWFTVKERIAANGDVVQALSEEEVDRVIRDITARGLRHVAVCLLFSFINPQHEQMIGRACQRAGLEASLSSTILPEFREYERASTTVINAALRSVVQEYLAALEGGLAGAIENVAGAAEKRTVAGPDQIGDPVSHTSEHHQPVDPDLRVMHSGGGTLGVPQAIENAARLVLSGPAGGVMGACFVADLAGLKNVITYDMGGTSTDVAVILDGRPQWTTSTMVDGLPLGLPMFDIHTVGAGGGSIASLDGGGALGVGPKSAGAFPGPACYGRGGNQPTVTDANLVLGRIVADHFLGGAMRVDAGLATRAIAPLGRQMNKSVTDTALGIIRVAEANMEHAIRQVTSRRGHDPRQFALVSFGGAGGLHACALAESLEITRVLIPPYCGVLSALGMVVAPPIADASRTVVHLGAALDDERLIAEFGSVNGLTIDQIPHEQTQAIEAYADVRFRGQSHEVKVRVERPTLEHIHAQFTAAYQAMYGGIPSGRSIEIVTLRIRRIGRLPKLALPKLARGTSVQLPPARVIGSDGTEYPSRVCRRSDLPVGERLAGPILLVDAQATTFIPKRWSAVADENGSVLLERP